MCGRRAAPFVRCPRRCRVALGQIDMPAAVLGRLLARGSDSLRRPLFQSLEVGVGQEVKVIAVFVLFRNAAAPVTPAAVATTATAAITAATTAVAAIASTPSVTAAAREVACRRHRDRPSRRFTESVRCTNSEGGADGRRGGSATFRLRPVG